MTLDNIFKEWFLEMWGREYDGTHGPDLDEHIAYKAGYEQREQELQTSKRKEIL